MYPFGFFYENKHVKNGLSSAIKAVQTHAKMICDLNEKQMSRLMGKPTICIGENKDADREADQCLCFRHSDSIIPLLLKSEISSF